MLRFRQSRRRIVPNFLRIRNLADNVIFYCNSKPNVRTPEVYQIVGIENVPVIKKLVFYIEINADVSFRQLNLKYTLQMNYIQGPKIATVRNVAVGEYSNACPGKVYFKFLKRVNLKLSELRDVLLDVSFYNETRFISSRLFHIYKNPQLS